MRLAMTKSRVFPESIAASLVPRIWSLADAAMLVPANLSRSTFQSPATTPIGDLLQQRQQCGHDGDIGLRLEPRASLEVHGNDHQPPLHPRQLNGNEPAPFNAERLDQARVGLPGCGNHKTPFVVVGLRGTGPKGMKPLTEKGGLCLRLLLKAEVRLLRKEAGRLGVLVPAKDFRPPLGNVSNR